MFSVFYKSPYIALSIIALVVTIDCKMPWDMVSFHGLILSSLILLQYRGKKLIRFNLSHLLSLDTLCRAEDQILVKYAVIL